MRQRTPPSERRQRRQSLKEPLCRNADGDRAHTMPVTACAAIPDPLSTSLDSPSEEHRVIGADSEFSRGVHLYIHNPREPRGDQGGHPLRARAPVRRDASKAPRRAGARGKVARTMQTRGLTRGIARLPPVQTTEPFVDVRPLSRGAPGGRPLWTLRKGKPTTQRDATSCVRVGRSSRRRKSLHSSRSRPGRAWQGCCLVETARLAPPSPLIERAPRLRPTAPAATAVAPSDKTPSRPPLHRGRKRREDQRLRWTGTAR